MKSAFINNYLCEVLRFLQNHSQEDLEREVNDVGKDIGRRLAMILDFHVEDDLNSLIYRIVFELLPQLFQAERRIEAMENNPDNIIFLVYETKDFLKLSSSAESSFCSSSLIAGIIEAILRIFDSKLDVVAHNPGQNDNVNQVIYAVKLPAAQS